MTRRHQRAAAYAAAVFVTLWLGCRDWLVRVDDNLADLEDATVACLQCGRLSSDPACVHVNMSGPSPLAP